MTTNQSFLAMTILIAALLAVTGCGFSGQQDASTRDDHSCRQARRRRGSRLQTRTVQHRIAVVGTLHGLKIQISAKVAGRLEQVLVDVGDRLQPGEK